MMDILFKLRERICRPLQMSHKLQSSTLGNLAKYSHMGELLAALQGQYHLVERKGGAIAKIIHAEMTQKNEKGPPSFQELGQTYMNISEDTANVSYVLSKARDSFNDPSLELVTSNGLKIMDNEGTKGHC